jgi:hypothetical protein
MASSTSASSRAAVSASDLFKRSEWRGHVGTSLCAYENKMRTLSQWGPVGRRNGDTKRCPSGLLAQNASMPMASHFNGHWRGLQAEGKEAEKNKWRTSSTTAAQIMSGRMPTDQQKRSRHGSLALSFYRDESARHGAAQRQGRSVSGTATTCDTSAIVLTSAPCEELPIEKLFAVVTMSIFASLSFIEQAAD